MHLKLHQITALALVGLLTTGAFAQGTDPAAIVKERQALMKSMGGAMRGASDLTGQAAIDQAKVFAADFDKLPTLFPEGSVTDDSAASPAIWENAAGFAAEIGKAQAQAAVILAAAEAGDMAAYGKGIQGLGAVCGECHQGFRLKK
jgi:cytochrome c556